MARDIAHHRNPQTDPVASATALLRRLGFATLMLAIPSVALVSRRAVVVLAPIGISLLIIAALLDGENRPVAQSNRAFAGSRPVIAGVVLLVWIPLSLLWTPFFEPAAHRVTSILATTALGVAGYYALPDRMRSANLYLVAIGVAVAAVLAAALALADTQVMPLPADRLDTLERGLVVIVIAVWPAVAWLSSRKRDVQALLLALAAGAASALGPTFLPFAAFVAGGIVCIVAASAPRIVARLVAYAFAGLILFGPVLALIAATFEAGPVGGPFAAWRDIMFAEPLRIVTGYGIESVLRSRAAGLIATDVPSSILFEIWYELGIVGAVAGAIALHGAIMAAARHHPPLVPGALAAFTSGFVLAALGVATTQMWWFTTLVVVVLIFIAVARGQFRTTRPKVLLRMIGER